MLIDADNLGCIADALIAFSFVDEATRIFTYSILADC